MNKEQAIMAMQAGQKITHTTFTAYEWISIDPHTGHITMEEGYLFHPIDFWRYRTLPCFNDGYSLYQEF